MPSDYIHGLQIQSIADAKSQLGTLALEFGGVLNSFPKLKADLDRIIENVDSATDSAPLVSRLESQLVDLGELQHRIANLPESSKNHDSVQKALDESQSLTSLRNVSLCLSKLKGAVESFEFGKSRLDSASALREVQKHIDIIHELLPWEQAMEGDPNWCFVQYPSNASACISNDQKVALTHCRLHEEIACPRLPDHPPFHWWRRLEELHHQRTIVEPSQTFKEQERDILEGLFRSFKTHIEKLRRLDKFKREHLPRFAPPVLKVEGREASGDLLYDLLIIAFERAVKKLASITTGDAGTSH